MFNDRYGLTQAVIEGRKTMTRRIVPTKTRLRRALAVIHDEPHGSEQEEYLKSAYYKVGEIVAVAQNYSSFYNILDNTRPIPEGAGWDNKMFVRADLMPHQIRITGIRCEKLQDISDADCLKEGIFVNEYFGNGKKCHHYGFDGFFNETEGWFARVWFNTPREAFASLIDKVSGRGTWASNPWVVAYEFELVK